MSSVNRELYATYWDYIPDSEETPVTLFDIETNGLLDKTTKIHCICAKVLPSGETFSFRPHEIEKGLELLSKSSLLVAHNGLCFDIPAIKKLYPSLTLPPVFDTLTCSRLIWTNLTDLDFTRWRADQSKNRKNSSYPVFPKDLIGSHSLKAWGWRLGEYKGNYGEENIWDEWSEEMQSYCEQDVEVLHCLYKAVLNKKYSKEALALEHEFQKVIFDQEQTGVHFDTQEAERFYQELLLIKAEKTMYLQEMFPPQKIEEVFIPKVNNKTRGYVKGVPFTKVSYKPFNPNSRSQIAERLIERHNWQPSEFTETGQPKVDETVLATLPYEECPALIEFLELSKIIGMLAEGNNAWLKLVDEQDRIHGRVITNGAVTGRCTHKSPNLAQIPSRGTYGHKCRSLFTAPKNMVQIGADASGLELRMFAHYLARWDKGEYGKVILEGDIHTANQQAAGLETRDNAKTFIYAFLYGAGDEKIGSIVAPLASPKIQKKRGAELRDRFLKSIPAIGKLNDAVKDTLKGKNKRDFLIGVDGRRLHIRAEHSALNTLLQSAGAVLVKFATVIFHWECQKKGFVLGKDYEQVLHVHDEAQFYSRPEIAEEIGKTFVEAIELAGRHFGMRCPTTGEYKTGQSWADTH